MPLENFEICLQQSEGFVVGLGLFARRGRAPKSPLFFIVDMLRIDERALNSRKSGLIVIEHVLAPKWVMRPWQSSRIPRQGSRVADQAQP